MKKLITILAVFALVALTGCTKIDQTERGVVLHGGKYSGTVTPGYCVYVPLYTDIVHMPIKVRLETMRIEAGSKDMQKVIVGVNVNYHIQPDKVGDTYSKYGKDVVETALQTKMRETITGVTPQYDPEEMLQKREEIRLRMEQSLRAKLDSAQSYIVVDGFTIYEFTFSDAFSRAIEDKQVAAQNALKEKNVKEMVEYQRDQKKIAAEADSAITVMTARADSLAIAIKMKALANPHAAAYIKLQSINKWDGQVPQVSSDKSMTIVDLK